MNQADLPPAAAPPAPDAPYQVDEAPTNLLLLNLLAATVFLGYWIVVWALEYGAAGLAAGDPLALAGQFLRWRVLRHLLPLLVGGGAAWWFARRAAIQAARVLYDLADYGTAASFWRHRQSGFGRPDRHPYGDSWLRKLILFGGDKNPDLAAAGGCLIWLAILCLLVTAVAVWSAEQVAPRRVMTILAILTMVGLVGLLIRGLAHYLNLGVIMPVTRERLAGERRHHWFLQVGGPGQIFVGRTDVAVTEQNGRVGRVLGPGLHHLAPFERVCYLLDLRRQYGKQTAVPLMTRDKIALTGELAILYCIGTGGQRRTERRPFPYDEQAVSRAAYMAQTVLPDRESDWIRLAPVLARAFLEDEVVELGMDDIVSAVNPDADALQIVENAVANTLRRVLPAYGIELLELSVGPLRPMAAVAEHRVQYWRALWERVNRAQEAPDMLSERQIEQAVAQSQADELERLVDALAVARHSIGTAMHQAGWGGRHVALSYVANKLIDYLENMLLSAPPDLPERELLLMRLHVWRRRLAADTLPGRRLVG